MVELTHTWVLLLESGLLMMATLELARNAIYNRAVAQIVLDMRELAEEGAGQKAPLRRVGDVVPGVVTDM